MIIKTGNYIWCIFFVYGLLQAHALKLRILSCQEEPITNVELNTPFKLEVTVDHANPELIIKGLDQVEVLEVKSRRILMQLTGSHKMCYTYTVRARREGVLILGPAKLKSGTGTSSSSSIQVTQKREQEQDITCTITLDSPVVFVGQKVPFTVTCVYKQPSIMCKNISCLEVPDSDIEMGEPEVTSQTRKGIRYESIRTHGYIYPHREGCYKIGPLKVAYAQVHPRATAHIMGIMNMMGMRSGSQDKYCYTNSVTLVVHALPISSRKLDAIGQFSSLKASLSAKKVLQGDASLLTITLEGEEPISSVESFELCVPKECKYYPSNHTLEHKGTQAINQFEYVLQGLEPGLWTIPAQKFTYFNPQKKVYATLRTEPLSFIVEPREHTTIVAPPSAITPAKQPTVHEVTKELEQHIAYYKPRATSPAPLSWPLFFMLALVPAGGLFLRSLYVHMIGWLQRRRMLPHKVLYRAREQLKMLRKQDRPEQLYLLIKHAVCLWLKIAPEAITDEVIISLLYAKGVGKETIDQWVAFMRVALAYTTYAPTSDVSNTYALYQEADAWLERLYTVIAKKADYKRVRWWYSILYISTLYGCTQAMVDTEKAHELLAQKYSELRGVQQRAPYTDACAIEQILTQATQSLPGKAQASSRYKFRFLLYSWQLLFLSIWWSLLYLVRNGIAFTRARLYSIALLCMLILIGGIGLGVYYRRVGEQGIIKKTEALLRIGPDSSYPVKGELHLCDNVFILKKRGSWYYVSSIAGTGWISADTFFKA